MTTARTVEEIAQRITLRAKLVKDIIRDEDESAHRREISAETLLARRVQQQITHHPKGK